MVYVLFAAVAGVAVGVVAAATDVTAAAVAAAAVDDKDNNI